MLMKILNLQIILVCIFLCIYEISRNFLDSNVCLSCMKEAYIHRFNISDKI